MSSNPEIVASENSGSGDVAEEPQVPLEGEALREAILKQCEYYLSQDNVSKDQFLVSNMNAQQYVPVSLLAEFNKLKVLTSDVNLISDVLRSSKLVTVDSTGTMVRPNFVTQRNVIMIRDIPSDTKEEEIRKLFSEEHQSKIVNVKADVRDTHFVTLADEKSAQDALFFLHTQRFNGTPVRACIKSQNILRNVPAPKPAANFVPAPMPFPAYPPYMNSFYPYQHQQFFPVRADMNRRRKQQKHRREYDNEGQHNEAGNDSRYENSYDRSRDRKRLAKNKRSRGGSNHQNVPAVANAQEFPPLPSVSASDSGYEHDFKKYTPEEIIKVVTTMKPFERPSSLTTSCPAVTSEAIFEPEYGKLQNKSMEFLAKPSFAEAANANKEKLKNGSKSTSSTSQTNSVAKNSSVDQSKHKQNEKTPAASKSTKPSKKNEKKEVNMHTQSSSEEKKTVKQHSQDQEKKEEDSEWKVAEGKKSTKKTYAEILAKKYTVDESNKGEKKSEEEMSGKEDVDKQKSNQTGEAEVEKEEQRKV